MNIAIWYLIFVRCGCVTDLKSHTESYFLESSTAFFCLITAFVCLLHELSLLSEWVALGCIDHVVVNYSEYCDPVINCSTASYLQWTDGDGGFLLCLGHCGWRADHPVCLGPILLAQILASAAGVGCNNRPNCWLQLHRWGQRQACTGMRAIERDCRPGSKLAWLHQASIL